jgi:arginyl-tRNA synthetase
VIPADLGAELARAVSAVIAAGQWPAAAGQLPVSGTWRPAPGGASRGARGGAARGSRRGYATSLPFELSRLTGDNPADIAGRLAGLIQPVGWISSAAATGGGYLTITVTPAALAGVAVRVARAGAACARSDVLRGVRRDGRPLPDLAAAASWRQAWQEQAAALTGRLAAAAGATVTSQAGRSPSQAGRSPRRPPGELAGAVAYAGADAVRYWLARQPAGPAAAPADGLPVTHDLGHPFYAVSFAHADAASVLRWAGDLGAARSAPDERLAAALAEPAELALLAQLSWLGERVAGAARRAAPADLPRYLEELAATWLTCRESCPALPFGGRAAPRDPAGISARLWLAAATAAALAAGLRLIGISAAGRL